MHIEKYSTKKTLYNPYSALIVALFGVYYEESRRLHKEVHRSMKKYQDLQLLARRWFPLWKLDGYILREFLIK